MASRILARALLEGGDGPPQRLRKEIDKWLREHPVRAGERGRRLPADVTDALDGRGDPGKMPMDSARGDGPGFAEGAPLPRRVLRGRALGAFPVCPWYAPF